MKRSLFFLAVFFLFVATPSSLEAHQILSDGTMSVLLHMEPGDDPIAGEDATLHFYIQNTKGAFTPDDCFCTISISQNNKELVHDALNKSTDAALGSGVFSYPYVFPTRAVYAVTIEGTSKSSTFPNFSITYDVRVDRVGVGSDTGGFGFLADTRVWYAIGGVIVASLVVFIVKDRSKKRWYTR